jgi:hypothetical protein
MSDSMQTIEDFVRKWIDTPEKNKAAFLRLKQHLAAKPGTLLEFLPRPGVTYSLRARYENQKDKNLFALVDVIEDQPRWLSVCFYAEMIHDADERGEDVPGGILGEDAVCFDVEAFDEEMLTYLEVRMDEAHASAARV